MPETPPIPIRYSPYVTDLYVVWSVINIGAGSHVSAAVRRVIRAIHEAFSHSYTFTLAQLFQINLEQVSRRALYATLVMAREEDQNTTYRFQAGGLTSEIAVFGQQLAPIGSRLAGCFAPIAGIFE
jgi:hypothetical protein